MKSPSNRINRSQSPVKWLMIEVVMLIAFLVYGAIPNEIVDIPHRIFISIAQPFWWWMRWRYASAAFFAADGMSIQLDPRFQAWESLAFGVQCRTIYGYFVAAFNCMNWVNLMFTQSGSTNKRAEVVVVVAFGGINTFYWIIVNGRTPTKRFNSVGITRIKSEPVSSCLRHITSSNNTTVSTSQLARDCTMANLCSRIAATFHF